MENPFDKLSITALLFLKERTDWSEGFLGYGFATQFCQLVKEAYNRKIDDNEYYLLEKWV